MNRARVTSIAIAVALATGLAACGAPADTNKETIDLVIGGSLPLSGDLEAFGPSAEKAAGLARDEIEAAIKDTDADHTVKLLTEDNGGGSDPQAAITAARKLADADSDCITGAWGSDDTISTAEEVTIPGEIALVSPASTSDEVSALDDGDLVSRTVPPDRYQGRVLADAIEKDLGDAKGSVVNIGARNDAYGTGLADNFTQAWEDRGGEVGDTVVYDPGQPGYDSEAAQITAGKPDATLIIDYPATFADVGPALAATGDWDPKTAWGSDGLATADTAKLAGEDTVDGMRVTAPGIPEDGDATQAFTKLLGDEKAGTDTFAAQTFDAVILCYLGAVSAGSTDGTEIGQAILDVSGPEGDSYTYEDLSGAIDALEDDEDIDYDGVSGELDMDKAGDPTEGVYDVFEFSKGALEAGDQLPVDEDD